MMRISTKGRYAIRVMVDLAQHGTNNRVPLKDISKRQNITVRYLEIVVSFLLQARLVQSFRGKGGGYRLACPIAEISLLDILRCSEGELVPVQCLEQAVNRCPLAANCKTLPVWTGFYELTHNYFKNISLEQLLHEENAPPPICAHSDDNC